MTYGFVFKKNSDIVPTKLGTACCFLVINCALTQFPQNKYAKFT